MNKLIILSNKIILSTKVSTKVKERKPSLSKFQKPANDLETHFCVKLFGFYNINTSTLLYNQYQLCNAYT